MRVIWQIIKQPWTPFVLVALAYGVWAHATGQFMTVQKRTLSSVACSYVGGWFDLQSSRAVTSQRLITAAATRDVVLLGRTDLKRDQYKWFLHTLAALGAERDAVVLLLDIFPRLVQPILDHWVAGELSEIGFRAAMANAGVGWTTQREVHMPLLHYARLQRVPIVAAAVSQDFIRRVVDEGWEAIPEDERRGLTNPDTASLGYVRTLAASYLAAHPDRAVTGDNSDEGLFRAQVVLSDILADPGFQRFVQAHNVLDRAIAEAVVQSNERFKDALVVAIVDRSRLEFGWGVPAQLDDLDSLRVSVLLPIIAPDECAIVRPGLADVVFILDQAGAPKP
jgi:hypothetical protein